MQKGVMFFHSMLSFRENRVRKLKCTRSLTRYGCPWCLNESYLKVDFLEIDPSSEQNFALRPQLIFILRITFLFLLSRKFAKCIYTRHFQIWKSIFSKTTNTKFEPTNWKTNTSLLYETNECRDTCERECTYTNMVRWNWNRIAWRVNNYAII